MAVAECGGSDPMVARQYPATVAAEELLEHHFSTGSGLVLLWRHVASGRHTTPDSVWRLARCYPRRVVRGRAGRRPHRAFPQRLFVLLRRLDHAASILSSLGCTLDEWTSSMLERYDSIAPLSSADFLAELHAVVSVLGGGHLEHRSAPRLAEALRCCSLCADGCPRRTCFICGVGLKPLASACPRGRLRDPSKSSGPKAKLARGRV